MPSTSSVGGQRLVRRRRTYALSRRPRRAATSTSARSVRASRTPYSASAASPVRTAFVPERVAVSVSA
ncbi:hypothetical protein ABTZ59_17650 [Streptomyces sp. NPDC094034]|uniref:hypothetical protein n=1 Tax=Streptomyces sp. NPDC094034 TaxID=3155309 RepID=UPI00332E5824